LLISSVLIIMLFCSHPDVVQRIAAMMEQQHVENPYWPSTKQRPGGELQLVTVESHVGLKRPQKAFVESGARWWGDTGRLSLQGTAASQSASAAAIASGKAAAVVLVTAHRLRCRTTVNDDGFRNAAI
jgi:hypothetical protein